MRPLSFVRARTSGAYSKQGCNGGRRLRLSGGRRATVTLVDQACASVSNFAVGVAVARVAGPAGLGGFSFAYAGWLVLSDLHRSLITDPMSIENDAWSDERADRVRSGFAAELVLGLAVAVVFVVIALALIGLHEHTFAWAMLALAPWLPTLVAQDYWRWIGFMTQRPGLSLANDAVFNVVQIAAFAVFLVTNAHSVAAVIAAWGLGGLAGSVYGLRQYRVVPTLFGGLRLLRNRWIMSKWLAGTSLTNWGATQAYVFIAGGLLGPAGLGGLKAAQTLVSGPSGVLIQAGGSIGLPEAAKAYSEKGWTGLLRVSRVVTVAGFLSFGLGAAVVVGWGRKLLTTIYGPAFGHMYTAAILIAIGYVLIGFFLGPVLVLKATRNTRRLFLVQVTTLLASLSSVAALSALYGTTGAALATICSYSVASIGYRIFQRIIRREVAGEAAGNRGEAEILSADSAAV